LLAVVVVTGTAFVVVDDIRRAGVWTVASTAAVAIALRLVLDLAVTTAFAPLASTKRVWRPIGALLALAPLEVLGIVVLWESLPFFAYFVVHAGIGVIAAVLQVRALQRQLRVRAWRALHVVRAGFSATTLVRSFAYAMANVVIRGDALVVSALLWAAMRTHDVDLAARIAIFAPVLAVATGATRGFVVDIVRCFDTPSAVLRRRALALMPLIVLGAVVCSFVLAGVAVFIAGSGALAPTLLASIVLAATSLWTQALVLDRRPLSAIALSVLGATCLLFVLRLSGEMASLAALGAAGAAALALTLVGVGRLRLPREAAGLFADPTTLRARAGLGLAHEGQRTLPPARFVAFRVISSPSVPRSRLRAALADALGQALRGACFVDPCTIVAVVVDLPWAAHAPQAAVVRAFSGLLASVWEHAPLDEVEPMSRADLTPAEARRRTRLSHAVATGDAVFPSSWSTRRT
jgi:hypothetical protein